MQAALHAAIQQLNLIPVGEFQGKSYAAKLRGADLLMQQLQAAAALPQPPAAPPYDPPLEVLRQLEGLRPLAAAAQPGPWALFGYAPGAYEICKADNYATGGVGQADSRANGEFMVASANFVRALLAATEAQGAPS